MPRHGHSERMIKYKCGATIQAHEKEQRRAALQAYYREFGGAPAFSCCSPVFGPQDFHQELVQSFPSVDDTSRSIRFLSVSAFVFATVLRRHGC